uniref:Peptidase C1A papain C-terminal domain-containing protein n=1 Tax=Parascaris equorum TaxID=6256 RepID=A0A914RVB2_PAREQ
LLSCKFNLAGVYHPFTFPEAQELYGHCAKLIGWGVSDGEEYWLYMNTWGREWGEGGL